MTRAFAPAGRLKAVFAGLVLAGALPAGATDLVDAWQGARLHDPAFAAAQAERDAGASRERQGRALLLPAINATAGTGRATDDRDTTGARFVAPGFGDVSGVGFHTRVANGTSTSWAVTLEQPLLDAGRFASAGQGADQARAAEARYAMAHQDLMLATVRSYLDLLYAQERRDALAAQKAALAEAQEAAQAMFSAGRIPVTDAAEAQARLDEADADLIGAEDALAVAGNAFTLRTGLAPAGLAPVRAQAAAPEAADAGLDAWLQKARDNSPMVQAQDLNARIAQREVSRFRAEYAPTLDLVARAGADRLWGDSGWGPSTVTGQSRYIGLQLTVPVFTGGMRSARHDESVALAERAREDLAAARQQAELQARAAWLAVRSAPAQLQARQRAYDSAQLRLDATETGHEAGARTMLDLLGARADQLRARLALVQERHAVLYNRLRLAAAAGELSEEELARANALLEHGHP